MDNKYNVSDSDSDSNFGFSLFSTAPAAPSQTKEIIKRATEKHSKRKSATNSSKYSTTKSKHRDEEGQKKDKNKRRRTKDKEKHESRLLQSNDPWYDLASQGIATVDLRGNNDLKLFDGATKAGTPRFSRKGGRKVLGLKGRLVRMDEDAENDGLRIVLETASKEKPKRYSDIDWRELDSQKTEKMRDLSALCVNVSQEQRGFVPLVDRNIAGKRDTRSVKYDSDDEDNSSRRKPDFKSIDGDAGQRPRIKDKQMNEATEEKSSEEQLCRQKIIEYERKLASDPNDIDTWVLLASVQEEVIRASFGSSSQHKIKRSVAETRMEIYKRALSSNPLSTRLALAYLNECKEVMSDMELLDEWKKTLDTFCNQPQLVMQHVRACQGMGTLFSIDRMAEVYAAAIRRIMRIICDRVSSDASRKIELSVMILDLIHCFCLMLREAGFAERAVSVYQAVIEWYVLTPKRLWSAPYSHRMRAFEDFWDSGTPRIGSDGACGWCKYADSDTNVSSYSGSLAKDGFNDNLVYETPDLWCNAEKQSSLDKSANLPAAVATSCLSDSVIDSIDPFSVVVFEDVQPFLADIPWDSAVARALFDRSLQFLGIVGPRTFVFAHELASESAGMGMTYTVAAAGDDIAQTVKRMSIWQPTSKNQEETFQADQQQQKQQGNVMMLSSFPFVSVP
ncbi:hypothetical protein FB639_002387, partial [Coemansia asiatica]